MTQMKLPPENPGRFKAVGSFGVGLVLAGE
jgi:hypothetical protein